MTIDLNGLFYLEEWFLSIPCPIELALSPRLKFGILAQMVVADPHSQHFL